MRRHSSRQWPWSGCTCPDPLAEKVVVALRRIYEILDHQENGEGGSIIAEYPPLPGSISQRRTREALANMCNAISRILKVREQ
jgi:predicted RNase H-like HicB family nuclease